MMEVAPVKTFAIYLLGRVSNFPPSAREPQVQMKANLNSAIYPSTAQQRARL
jgi:hypothetical protein